MSGPIKGVAAQRTGCSALGSEFLFPPCAEVEPSGRAERMVSPTPEHVTSERGGNLGTATA